MENSMARFRCSLPVMTALAAWMSLEKFMRRGTTTMGGAVISWAMPKTGTNNNAMKMDLIIIVTSQKSNTRKYNTPTGYCQVDRFLWSCKKTYSNNNPFRVY